MKYIILILGLILLGNTPLSLTQQAILNKYAILDVPVNVVSVMPKECAKLQGCVIVKIYKTRFERDLYVSKNAKDFEDVLAHEIVHYFYTNETEAEVQRLTPILKDYINTNI